MKVVFMPHVDPQNAVYESEFDAAEISALIGSDYVVIQEPEKTSHYKVKSRILKVDTNKSVKHLYVAVEKKYER
ncbi:hypothetical protein GJ688_05140 [Heliobacillus mobilis]|uniref:Uncharacterized protein n=1 Tax=Heliobacterium mobile TaxID=28064 RepID=A0A6I3SHR3_HELMO|nr:hypothetical protein [Heliobacterium mobile]MTV48366.1 hypothetical protein [Heliobacterium mobile]